MTEHIDNDQQTSLVTSVLKKVSDTVFNYFLSIITPNFYCLFQ